MINIGAKRGRPRLVRKRLPVPRRSKPSAGFEILKKPFLWAAFLPYEKYAYNFILRRSFDFPTSNAIWLLLLCIPSGRKKKPSSFGILTKYTLNWKTFNLNFSFSITFPERSLWKPNRPNDAFLCGKCVEKISL